MHEMKERKAPVTSGFLGLIVTLALAGAGVYAIVQAVRFEIPIAVVGGVILVAVAVILASGLFVVQPNEARAVVLFGRYLGSVRENGWWWTVPLSSKKRVSLRVHNFNSERLKVNDAAGSPIEIGAVVVYRVTDSARALFDVENYEQFVAIQSETAIRHLASRYPYDSYEEGGRSLRGNPEEVAHDLREELEERLRVAGVEVIEARLTHLAYAPEIASAMLQRQQAEAIVSARQKIVEGAVGMVQMALERLTQEDVIHLDEERKAAMINNLMVAIVSERAAQPVINAGTLY